MGMDLHLDLEKHKLANEGLHLDHEDHNKALKETKFQTQVVQSQMLVQDKLLVVLVLDKQLLHQWLNQLLRV
jgi:hypothetical protein